MTVRKAEGFITSDQTGKFPRMFNKGNQYSCVFYIYDPNFTKGISIKNRKKEELLKAHEQVYEWCERRGFKPQLQKMDNETSKDVEDTDVLITFVGHALEFARLVAGDEAFSFPYRHVD